MPSRAGSSTAAPVPRLPANSSSATFPQDVSGRPISRRCLPPTTTIAKTMAEIHELQIRWDNPADSPDAVRSCFHSGPDRECGLPRARREDPDLPGTGRSPVPAGSICDSPWTRRRVVSAQQERRHDSSSHGSRSAKTLEPSEELVCSRRAVDRSRRRRRILRARARQSRSAPADRHAVPRRARLSRPSSSTGASCRPPRSRFSSATSPTRSRRDGSRRARAAATSARCPYGINTVSLFAHVFLVMLPAKALAEQRAPRIRRASRGRRACSPRSCRDHRARGGVRRRASAQGHAARSPALDACRHRPGLHLARLPVPHIRASGGRPHDARHRPPHLFRPRAIQGPSTRRRRRRRASARCSRGRRASRPSARRPEPAAFHLPVPVFGDLFAALGGGHLLPYLSVIIAMSLFNVLGSLQNIESAEAAGDSYDTRTSLRQRRRQRRRGALRLCFPTTIYIGHPGWKALGAPRRLFGA